MISLNFLNIKSNEKDLERVFNVKMTFDTILSIAKIFFLFQKINI